MKIKVKDVLIDNEYMKQIRLVDGVLVNIYKCDFKEDISWHIENKRKQLLKIEDSFYKLKEPVVNKWTKEELPMGTVLYKMNNCTYFPINRIKEKSEWEWEIKTTGTAFNGDTNTFKSLVEYILELIESE